MIQSTKVTGTSISTVFSQHFFFLSSLYIQNTLEKISYYFLLTEWDFHLAMKSFLLKHDLLSLLLWTPLTELQCIKEVSTEYTSLMSSKHQLLSHFWLESFWKIGPRDTMEILHLLNHYFLLVSFCFFFYTVWEPGGKGQPREILWVSG